MRIAIDLDNTITQYPDFFRCLTSLMMHPHEVHIVTARDPEGRAQTEQALAALGIHFDQLAITDDKQRYIMQHHIDVFFEDMDEHIVGLPESVAVFKVREPLNYDFNTHQWIYAGRTGRPIRPYHQMT